MPDIPPIVFGPHASGSADHEWLVTDGLGGYACGTAAGLRTRRRHALLTVADQRRRVRQVALVALDLTVTLPSGTKVPLYTHEWASGATDPQGHRHLETFALVEGVPRWRWRIGDVVIEREVAMRYGHPSVAVVHRVLAAPGPVGLAVATMCTWREADAERRADGPVLKLEQVTDGVIVEDAYRVAGPGWQPGGGWHLGARTRVDAVRGRPAEEDLWLAGTYFQPVNSGETLEISAWAGDPGTRPPAPCAVVAEARRRARGLVTTARAEGSGATLVLAADAFVVRTADGPDVLAGYPDCAARLGETMTAYEGLFLATGRADEGRELLLARTRAATVAPDPHDSPDAPLWLVHAVDRHVTRTGDTDLAARLAAPLGRLLRRRLGGAGPLSVDPADELLRLDPDGGPTTECPAGSSRIGKPVEINALWVNALAALGGLLAAAGRDGSEALARHARAHACFHDRFPAPEGWLYDVVGGPPAAYPLGAGTQQDDPTLRPHQLLAWSLPHAPMAGGGLSALRALGAGLLTPLGLRTLAPSEYGYQGVDGDTANHQGTVWPWLIGPYADARAAAGLPTQGLTDGLEAHLAEWGVGSVSETADGDPPHRGTGNPFAARAVAELLRVREAHP